MPVVVYTRLEHDQVSQYSSLGGGGAHEAPPLLNSYWRSLSGGGFFRGVALVHAPVDGATTMHIQETQTELQKELEGEYDQIVHYILNPQRIIFFKE